MANPYHHAVSSARRWGGRPEDYLAVHEWFDEPKGWIADARQRAIRHHSEGIAEAITLLEPVVLESGRVVPIRWIGEQHVMEDLGQIPTAADWLRRMTLEPWMNHARKLSRELE